MPKIDCNCIDSQTKIYLRNLLVSDFARSTADKDTAIELSKPEDIPKIKLSYETISKNFKEIFNQLESIDICK